MASTAFKIKVARAISTALSLVGLKRRRAAARRGVKFDLDLGEGIELSLFLFGRFQQHVLSLIERFVPPDGIVIDVGANVGAIALPAAAMLREGHVYAIEPTDYAYAKLRRNLELNPQLAGRVTPVHSFVAEVSRHDSELIAYSSWPVRDEPRDAHPVHRGVAKSASCGQLALDDFVARQKLVTVSLIKIDTDGHEFAVLRGATDVLARFRPVVVFEACAYLMEAPRPVFADFERLLREQGYSICDARSLKPIDAREFARKCPKGGGMDLIAMPGSAAAEPAP